MFRSFISVAWLLMISPAFADPVEDAEYIVDETVTAELLRPVMAAMGESMAAGIRGELLSQGVSLSDEASLVIAKIATDHMIDPMVSNMRAGTILAMMENISDEGLSEYRAFLETSAGQELVAATPELARAGERIGAEIAPGIAMLAVSQMIEDIQSDRWPDAVAAEVKDEIRAIYGIE